MVHLATQSELTQLVNIAVVVLTDEKLAYSFIFEYFSLQWRVAYPNFSYPNTSVNRMHYAGHAPLLRSPRVCISVFGAL